MLGLEAFQTMTLLNRQMTAIVSLAAGLGLSLLLASVTKAESPPLAAEPEVIKFSILISEGGLHRNLVRELGRRFQQAHPDIRVELLEMTNDVYHRWFSNWQEQDVDLLWYFAGYQLEQLARAGDIADISALWEQQGWDQSFASLKESVSTQGRNYALPLSYYHWGFFYKKSLFERYDLEPPKSWDEFLALCDRLKQEGITPLGLSTASDWPAASWFSYINLRLNGLDFHLNLLHGHESYLDGRVTRVLRLWKSLIDKGYFMKASHDYQWQEVLPHVYRGKVGLYLMGSFMPGVMTIPAEEFGFFRFSTIDESVPVYEEAPTDVIFINSRSEHKEAAKTFLAFMARPDIQYIYNESLGFVTPNSQAPGSERRLVRVSSSYLNQAEGLSQYFDRDTTKTMAESGFSILGAFARNPNVQATQKALEAARRQAFPGRFSPD